MFYRDFLIIKNEPINFKIQKMDLNKPMLLKKAISFLLPCTISVCAELPLRESCFVNQNDSFKILLPFEAETDITKFEIYESKIGELPDFTLPIRNSNEINLKNNILNTLLVDILYIDLSFVDKDKGSQYTVCVTIENEENTIGSIHLG